MSGELVLGLLGRLGQLDSCVVSDALDVLGHNGVIQGVLPLFNAERIVGSALTVRVRARVDADRNSTVPHLGARAIESGSSDNVIVVSNQARSDCASWGGLLSRAAQAKGIRGAVIDGLARDVDEAQEMSFPVFARGATPVSARSRIVEEAFNVPLVIDGVEIAAGDLVIGDMSGVVFVPRDIATKVLQVAEDLVEREGRIVDAIRDGVDFPTVFDARYEQMTSPSFEVSHQTKHDSKMEGA